MSQEYRDPNLEQYRMVYQDPHQQLEPEECEIEIVDDVLRALQRAGILPHTRYDQKRFLAHRQAIRRHFDIPWTAITPRMQRLLYAISAIRQPRRMIAAGVFCGNTFISNAGAGVGPGACYLPEDLLGVEIKPEEAERAEHNVRRIDPSGVARVVAADAVDIARDYPYAIDMLYLDADGDKERGKGIYLDILNACSDRLTKGGLILAHNSANCAQRLKRYLDFVRTPANLAASLNVVFDIEGLEVSMT